MRERQRDRERKKVNDNKNKKKKYTESKRERETIIRALFFTRTDTRTHTRALSIDPRAKTHTRGDP